MQATGTLRETGFSKGIALVVIAMASALLLGGVGGYAARNVNAPAHAQPAVQISQGGPDSDLTRALPTAAPKAAPDREPQPDHGLIP